MMGEGPKSKEYLTGTMGSLYLAEELGFAPHPPCVRESLILLLPSSFINSSSRNYGERLQPLPHPGPGPVLHSQAHRMRRSHLGQVMVRRVRDRGEILVFPEHHDPAHPVALSLGSSPASSPRQQWGTQRAQDLFPRGFQETTDTQKEPLPGSLH